MAQKVAIVTGASRGIGAALALELAREGYAVACAARATRDRPQDLPGTLDDVLERILDIGGTAIAVPVDVTQREQVAGMVERTVAEFGRLDVLVNNAGTTGGGGIESPLDWHDWQMAVNFDAPFIGTRHALQHMRALGEGRVLNVSSFTAIEVTPLVRAMSYSASKAALERMTLDHARELEPDSIAVNCFRVDAVVASEGTRRTLAGVELANWVEPAVAATGMAWMLRQPVSYTGRLESMRALAAREGIMPTVAARKKTPNRATKSRPPSGA